MREQRERESTPPAPRVTVGKSFNIINEYTIK